MGKQRGPESFIKRQRERAKQQEQQEKIARKRERSALKRAAKKGPDAAIGEPKPGSLVTAPLRPGILAPGPRTL